MRLADRLRELRGAGAPIVVPYLMVDRARLGRLRRIVRALEDGGASALELGFPFSDPIADGPVLEAAAGRALRHGTGWRDLVKACRLASPILPTAVMTYANPVWQEGLADGLHELARAGASGLIIPDLSLEESLPFRSAAKAAGLDLVLLAAPGSPRRRTRALARASRGFLYLVSRYGTTGAGGHEPSVNLRPIVRTAHDAAPALPVLVGFGVRDRATASIALASGADGVVVGTALEERMEAGVPPDGLRRWLGTIATAAQPRAGAGGSHR
ncbi:MAG TPA: tryptophan synthase subunit alpha [Thermoplasmata archaeon]|nr:tryptophan synthase subunit alpha [Thermoplasmata archaeon]